MEAVTKIEPNEVTSLQTTLEAMSNLEIVEYAREHMSLSINDPDMAKPDMIKAMVQYDTDVKDEARSENERSAAMVADPNKDPLIKIKFLPQDFPNAPVEFAYDSGRGIVDRRKPLAHKKQFPDRLRYLPRYNLFPHQIYELPLSVVTWLRSKTYSDSIPTFDSATGCIISNRRIIRPRFICEPILNKEQYMQLGKPKE